MPNATCLENAILPKNYISCVPLCSLVLIMAINMKEAQVLVTLSPVPSSIVCCDVFVSFIYDEMRFRSAYDFHKKPVIKAPTCVRKTNLGGGAKICRGAAGAGVWQDGASAAAHWGGWSSTGGGFWNG